MNQTQFERIGSGRSQAAKILQILTDAGGEWVPLPTLMRRSRSAVVHSRISDLRKAGHQIDWLPGRAGKKVRSWYRLVPSES
jgi:biotin operon repressor